MNSGDFVNQSGATLKDKYNKMTIRSSVKHFPTLKNSSPTNLVLFYFIIYTVSEFSHLHTYQTSLKITN